MQISVTMIISRCFAVVAFSCTRAYARLTIHVDYYRYYEINGMILLNITALSVISALIRNLPRIAIYLYEEVQ